jgi:membrane protein required for colicin V production
LNWLDILIALMVTLPTYFGFRKGFLRKLLGIAGIILGFILAIKFYVPVSSVLSTVIKGNPVFVNVLSFLIIIGILYGAAVWLARFIANMNSGTGMIDKILGTVTGFIQGLIISSVLLYNLALADMPSVQTRENSLLYKPVYKIAPVIFDKIIEYFPGLQELYKEYLSPKANNTEPVNTEPNTTNRGSNPEKKK